MSGIRWRRPKPRTLGPQFIRFPVNRFCIILTSPSGHTVLSLHWDDELGERGESFPCLGRPDCRYCPGVVKDYCYAPALVYLTKQRQWVPGILPIGDPGHTLANLDLAGVPIEIGRSKEKGDELRLIYYGRPAEDQFAAPPPAKAFDVRPPLLRRYGLFDLASEAEFEPYLQQGRLKFEDARKRLGADDLPA
jgi:hypothetical protein